MECQYYDDNKGFEIGAAGKTHSIKFAKISGGGIQIGINELTYQRSVIICAPSYCPSLSCRIYELDTTYLNILDINVIEKENKIIEGNFKFRAVNHECSDTILVTDGYFRTNYRP